ncbi:MAG: helix-turn-helix transcriptional regulator [Planctomycetota bacterium]
MPAPVVRNPAPPAPLRVEVRLRSPLDAEAYATRIDREPGFRVWHAAAAGPGDVRLTDRCPEPGETTPTVWLAEAPLPGQSDCVCCRRTSRVSDWRAVFQTLADAAGQSARVPKIAPTGDELRDLTRRERDVLRLVGEGKTVAETAAILGLAESTIGNHKHRIMRKLGVKTSLALLRIAVRNGLAPLE